jgi:DNA polymerase III gamma/tau subunit
VGVQFPRLKLGLVLISLLSFALLTPPNLSAARSSASQSVTARKVSQEGGKTKAVPKSTGKASTTGTAKGKPAAKGPLHSSAKSNSRPGAGPAKSPAKSASRGSTKSATRAASKTQAKRSQKTVYRQQQPEPERIRDIQQALSTRGYPLEVNGAWDASTVEALKKFQTDQKIENLSGKGKLDSMTLIALGLGPKREPPSGLTEEPKPTPEGKLQ